MKGGIALKIMLILCIGIMFTGCAPYVITNNLEVFIAPGETCVVGTITDELPADTQEKNKPTMENIDYLKLRIKAALDKADIFSAVATDMGEASFEVTGSILSYKKGNGFLRFLFGSLGGAGKITIELKLVDKRNGETIFGGNFTRKIGSWMETRNAMFSYVANDFARALKKQVKNIRKQVEQEG